MSKGKLKAILLWKPGIFYEFEFGRKSIFKMIDYLLYYFSGKETKHEASSEESIQVSDEGEKEKVTNLH